MPALSLGALEAPEAREVESHLDGCPECRAESRAFEAVALGLLESLPPARPSADLRRRTLSVTGTDQPAGTGAEPRIAAARRSAGASRSREWLGWGLALAASAALVLVLPESSRRQSELARRTAMVDSLRLELGQRAQQLAESRERLELLTAPDMHAVSLAAQPLTKEATARVIYSARLKRARLYVQNLPQAPQGKIYEVWLLAGGAPIQAGLFQPDSAGKADFRLLELADLSHAVAFAVTVEPQGGVPQPTGEKVLVGMVQ